jgi:hypothetical protein
MNTHFDNSLKFVIVIIGPCLQIRTSFEAMTFAIVEKVMLAGVT